MEDGAAGTAGTVGFGGAGERGRRGRAVVVAAVAVAVSGAVVSSFGGVYALACADRLALPARGFGQLVEVALQPAEGAIQAFGLERTAIAASHCKLLLTTDRKAVALSRTIVPGRRSRTGRQRRRRIHLRRKNCASASLTAGARANRNLGWADGESHPDDGDRLVASVPGSDVRSRWTPKPAP